MCSVLCFRLYKPSDVLSASTIPGVSLIAPAEGDDASVFTIKFDNATLENGVTIDGFLKFEQSYDLQFGIANGELDSLLFATTTAETRNIQLHVAVDSPRAGLSKSKVITHRTYARTIVTVGDLNC